MIGLPARRALQRDAQPRRPVVELVAQLVEQLLDLGELEQPAHVVERLEYPRAAHRLGVGRQECLARRGFPRLEVGGGALARRLRGVQHRRSFCVSEGAQHPRHVPQRRLLAPALGERTRGLALEIDDQEVVAGEQHLPEVIVAVVPRLEGRLGRRRARVDSLEHLWKRGLLGFVQPGERGKRLLAHSLLPGGHLLRRERLGLERRGAARRGERAVQLGGTRLSIAWREIRRAAHLARRLEEAPR
jgi:hypothetical protein